jgi:hypothetical protein
MKGIRIAVLAIVSTLVVGVSPHIASAQTMGTTASLSGTVSDPTGALIPKATIKLVSSENGVSRTGSTNSLGQFSFALLPPSSYTLTVEAKGFRTTRQTGIVLAVGDSLTDNVKMTIGTTQQVTVTAAAPLLQTQSADVGTVVSSRQIQQLPLNLRNVVGLVTLNSSVNNQAQQQTLSSGGQEDTADQDISFLNFGGGFFGSTAFLLDGGWDTADGWGGVVYVPSVADVQEFKVINNAFTAQYGWSTGNVVNIVTKSGTSKIHGQIYDYLRNQAMDANTFFNDRNGIEKTPDHREQFGFALGGPLYIPKFYAQTDKTFFFVNYEGLRLNGAGTDSEVVPTKAEEQGNFSALLGAQIGTDALGRPVYAGQIYNPYTTRQVVATSGPDAGQMVTIRDPYPNNIIPASGPGSIDELSNKLAGGSYWPSPINPGSGFNFNVSAAAPTHSDEFDIRIDHNFNANTRIYGRWSVKNEAKTGTPEFYGSSDEAGPGVNNPDNRYSVALGLTRVISPTLLVSTNLTFVRWVEQNHTQSYGFQPSSLGLPALIDSYSPQFPQINITGYAPLGARNNFGEYYQPNNTGSLSIDFNKTAGPHSLSFGYMGILLQQNGGRIAPTVFNFTNSMTAGPDPTNPSSGTGDGFASFMTGAGSSGSTGFNAFPAPTSYDHGVYVQDDWKAARNLTVNLGIRYSLQTPVRERYNRQAYFDYHALNPISVEVGKPYYGEIVYNTPGNRNDYHPNWSDVAPRLGFEYGITPHLVMRGGFGIFYTTNRYGAGNSPGYSQSTPWAPSLDGITVDQSLSQAFSSGVIAPTGNSLGGLTNVGYGGGGTNPYRPDPMVKQYMFGFQYGFTPSDVLDVSYVGNQGTNMILSSMNYGELDPKYLSMGSALNNLVPNPFYGIIQNSSCGLNDKMVPQAQLLLPYPEFCGGASAEQQPIGFSNYNALQVNYRVQATHDLTFMASYTYSKFLDDVGGPESWGSINGGAGSIRNYYDLSADKSVDANDVPQSAVLNYIYTVPVGRGKRFGGGMSRAANNVVGGWQISGITTMKAGFPLAIGNGGSNPASLWGGDQHATLVPGVSPKQGTCSNGNSVKRGTCWFNPNAFAQTPSYQFGDAPRYFSNLRAPGYFDTDLSLEKMFGLSHHFNAEFRAEFFNVFNHVNFQAPDTNYGDSTFGQVVNTQAPRQVQLALTISR